MLYDDIQLLDPALIASRDFAAIADALSAGRVKAQPTAIGKGTIIGVLGMAVGNAFLDVIDNVPDYRHIKDVIRAGVFDVSLEASKFGIDAMVPGVLTQAEANALKALGTAPDPVTAARVEVAMKNDDGTDK